jgi:predicted esterase
VPAAPAAPWPALFGFHGYGEDAARHLEALEGIPNADGWLLVAVQALHTFYTRDDRIVASWMTRQDREIAIADNIEYVTRVASDVMAAYGAVRPLVCAGFSQGGAMAYRAAASMACDGLIVLAADVPPDVSAAGRALPPVLLGRGTTDAWYTAEKMGQDVAALRGTDVQTCVFEGGHEWHPSFQQAAGEFLARLKRSSAGL